MRCAGYFCIMYRPICFLTCADLEVALADCIFLCVLGNRFSLFGDDYFLLA